MITNPAIKNADEIYIPVGSTKEAKKIYELNDESAKSTFRSRERQIGKAGVLNELELRDVAQRQRMEINKKAAQLMKGQ